MITVEQPALTLLLRALKLAAMAEHHEQIISQAESEGWAQAKCLRGLVDLELAHRRTRRVERLLKASGLPAEKTLATLNQEKLPSKVRRQLPALCEAGFIERAENVLIFGLPGRGKTHVACAIGHELIQRGHSVLFVSAALLVQRLLVAKKQLELEQELKRLDGFDAVLIDDIGYIQQDREEMEVLFTFLSERYERRSVLITSNLVFSQWDRIFKDPMTTAAAIDRVVHHAQILEMTGGSVRDEEARSRTEGDKKKPKREESD